MHFNNFHEAIAHATAALMQRGVEVNAGSWQGVSTVGKPDLVTLELMNLMMEVPVDRSITMTDGNNAFVSPLNLSHPDELTPLLAEEIKPNLPWADDHFDERVSRDPSNPGEEYKNWPWWRGQRAAAMEQDEQNEEIFSHTYQERFWPKLAGPLDRIRGQEIHGIRYQYGDLDDVVKLLEREPQTRQATFPIFFPEDTGAVHGGRVPCTLHYHFLLREGRLNLWYPIRSCDLVRHFRDDVYLACRLLLWVIQELQERELRADFRDEQAGHPDGGGAAQSWVDVRPGTLFFTAYSFHVHKGDLQHVRHASA